MNKVSNVFTLLEKIDPQYKNYKKIKKMVNEGKKKEFSFEKLSQIEDNEEAIKYCEWGLGPCVGMGSSRGVFQIDDVQVLKLALNDKGVAQNQVEAQTKQMKSPLFPYILYNDDNYKWIVTEYVLPAEFDDIEECLGIDISEFFYYIIPSIKDLKYNGGISEYEDLFVPKFGDCEFYRELAKYILNYDIPIGDIVRIENWGMTKRNGKKTLVILDPGWNKETMALYGFRPSS